MHGFFVTMMFFNAFGVLAICSMAMHTRADKLYVPIKVGLLVLMLGLLAQFGRDAQCIMNVCPTDAAWPPLWALKDIGAIIIITAFLQNGLRATMPNKMDVTS